MKIISAVGARPQFIKLKPISEVIKQESHEHVIIHTGQHYDSNMSDIFFEGLSIPEPDVNLRIGSGTHAQQTGEILGKIESQFIKIKPDWILVYGDTNSTLAAALAASKLGIPTAHVEAGLRSFNRAMPEEINRVLTDHASDLLFAPTKLAMQNLEKEGLSDNSYLVGDVMADLIYTSNELIFHGPLGNPIETNEDYLVATIHRASNTDDEEQLNRILNSLREINKKVYLVAHPRLRAAAKKFDFNLELGKVDLLEPLGYLQMLKLVSNSCGVITDSGGLQKEVFLLGVPCITIRTETEWPETLEGEMNVLNPTATNLLELLDRKYKTTELRPFGDGLAAKKIIEILETVHSRKFK